MLLPWRDDDVRIRDRARFEDEILDIAEEAADGSDEGLGRRACARYGARDSATGGRIDACHRSEPEAEYDERDAERGPERDLFSDMLGLGAEPFDVR